MCGSSVFSLLDATVRPIKAGMLSTVDAPVIYACFLLCNFSQHEECCAKIRC